MYGIEFAGFFCTQFGLFQGHHTIPFFNNAIDDCSGMAIFHCIRLDHGKSSVTHIGLFLRRKGRENSRELVVRS